MDTISRFGHFSGLTINWTKSALLLLDGESGQSVSAASPIPTIYTFKYLGVTITSNIRDYCRLNIHPLLSRFRDKVNTWSRLRLLVAGCTNIIKMILMTQLLYQLHNSPVLVPLKTFRMVKSIFRSPIWNNSPPRIKLEQLQNPKDEGGLARPNPWLYYVMAAAPYGCIPLSFICPF